MKSTLWFLILFCMQELSCLGNNAISSARAFKAYAITEGGACWLARRALHIGGRRNPILMVNGELVVWQKTC